MKKWIKFFIATIFLINLSACGVNASNNVLLEATVTSENIQLNEYSTPSEWINQILTLKVIDCSENLREDNLYDVNLIISEYYSGNASYTIENIYGHIIDLINSIKDCKSINSVSVSFVNDDDNSDVFMSFLITGKNICKINVDRISSQNNVLQNYVNDFFVRKVSLSDNTFYPADFLKEYNTIDEYIIEQLTIYFSDYFINVSVTNSNGKKAFYAKAYVSKTKDELISDWDTFLKTSSYSYKAYNSIVAGLSTKKIDFSVYSIDEVKLYNTVVDEYGKKFVYDIIKESNKNNDNIYSPSSNTSRTVYITPTGSKYHYSSSCNGGSYSATTLESAKNSGYTPCGKCVG